ncbi:hypothetical protein FRC15_011421 [Serendipita sp. 397]|nr:hypothetical protein FRC15_011421 [Serendipita sp. 397]KAG8823772.1 hypothetical protein FRC18_010667 [Serendipita sp. 400]
MANDDLRQERPSFDHSKATSSSSASVLYQDDNCSTPQKIPRSTSSDHRNNPSDPVSRSSSPAPSKRPPNVSHTRHIQRRIDSFTQIQHNDSFGGLDEDSRMPGDDASTSRTQSTAPPSECGSHDSERSISLLKPPEPRRRRTSGSTRTAGERDDGACTLPSPPPPLLRPTTFWKNTPRSALASPAYSPSTHLIRRATFVAAGFEPSEPSGDIEALCIGSRPQIHRPVVLPPESI